jgi:hypothetical protein
MPNRKELPCIAAKAWAMSVDIAELRKSAAGRVGISYGIPEEKALDIIIHAYRERKRNG